MDRYFFLFLKMNVSKWLEAHTDRSANLITLPRNAILADISGTGDYNLVITDLKFKTDNKSRLKTFRGTILISDQALPSLPNSLISFFADRLEPRIPVVGVACGSEVFFYKNLKPFYQFRVPSCPLIDHESNIWKEIIETKQFDVDKMVESLKEIPYSNLSSRSQQLLTEYSLTKAEAFIRKYMDSIPVKDDTITCMITLERTSKDKTSISCPIIATEFSNIYILDPQNFSIIQQANTCNTAATPFLIRCSGLYDVEFRILIATREGHICLLRKGWLEGKSLIQLKSDIVDMVLVPGDNFIVVASVDKIIQCFTKRGQRLWSSEVNSPITTMCLVRLEHLSTSLVAIGLKNGSIQFYQGRQAVDYLSIADSPSVIVFGQLGQEENVLVVITAGGSISFKILKRTAEFSNVPQESTPLIQSKPLPLPKRSKLFLEQSIRERQHALEIHQTFQQDLIRLRLTAARALIQNLTDQSGIGNEKEQIKLSAQVLGLGPKFTIVLTLENINPTKPLVGLKVTFHVNPLYYILSNYVIKIPLIPPSLSFKMQIKAKEIMEESGNEEQSNSNAIRVFVSRQEFSIPVLAATINMPPTELIA
ncbi:hypothetical protein ABEB36_012984 [Hypothenemus hampei]|uniref:Bardet-Biedl syndrome 1 n=1 Tax=Hypothenemus hampei TaxID=57062 RepID=A0ABD1E6R2_HYPHA